MLHFVQILLSVRDPRLGCFSSKKSKNMPVHFDSSRKVRRHLASLHS
jgi:hypothetical protein